MTGQIKIKINGSDFLTLPPEWNLPIDEPNDLSNIRVLTKEFAMLDGGYYRASSKFCADPSDFDKHGCFDLEENVLVWKYIPPPVNLHS